jgi:hypothetical protein
MRSVCGVRIEAWRLLQVYQRRLNREAAPLHQRCDPCSRAAPFGRCTASLCCDSALRSALSGHLLPPVASRPSQSPAQAYADAFTLPNLTLGTGVRKLLLPCASSIYIYNAVYIILPRHSPALHGPHTADALHAHSLSSIRLTACNLHLQLERCKHHVWSATRDTVDRSHSASCACRAGSCGGPSVLGECISSICGAQCY